MPATAAAVPAAVPAARRWLFGPGPDLFLGCGLGYALVFAAMALFGASFREAFPPGIAFILVSAVAGAHYGATAVRAYERSEDRRAYLFFTLWTTLALGACFVWGLASVDAGSWFVTTYLTWSPWHYALQNFGVAMTFLRRRGVTVTPPARRLLHLSFVLSFLLAAVALHGTEPLASYAPNSLDNGIYRFIPLGPALGVPRAAADVVLLVLGVAWGAVTVAAVALLGRAGTLRDLFPALALVATQSLWFSVPVLLRHGGLLQGVEPFSVAQAHYAFLWVGAGHAAQYLWYTAFFARSSGRSRSNTLFVAKSLLAGTALWWVPALLFAPGMLGRLPYDAGLAAMVAALVNLHHFVLDGVIWKLRDGRIARVLLGTGGAAPEPAVAPAAEPLARPAVRVVLWGGGALLLCGAGATAAITEFGFNRPYEAGDLDAARRAADDLERLAQPSAEMRLRLGQSYLEAGDLGAARTSLERSVEILPTAWAWVGLGDVHARTEQWRDAADAYARALELEPDHVVATFHAAAVALELGQRDRAARGLLRAKALASRDPSLPHALHEAIESVLADPRLDGVR